MTESTDPALTRAAMDVIAERSRQVSKEGWTTSHDDEHDEGDLSLAGAVYAITKGPRSDVPPAWPWEAAAFKPRDWRANLVRAGALILAEIERLDRADKLQKTAALCSGCKTPTYCTRNHLCDRDEALDSGIEPLA